MNRIASSLFRCVLVIAASGSVCLRAQERAADYPTRPLRIIIGIAPGGGLDTTTRIAAQKLSERLGQTAIVDNRPGGGTVLAMDMVAAATPDGYTLMCASETLISNGVLKRVKYDVRQAYVPIVQLTSQPYMLAANLGLPVKSVKELIAHARAKPGALAYGTPGIATTLHLGWIRFSAMAGIDVLHVPYKGGAIAILDMIGGQIQLLMTTTATIAPHARSGKVRVLAATGPKRIPAYPDVPTITESGLPGYELTNSYAFFAPARTPAAIVARINAALAQGMGTPETIKIFAADGAEIAAPATPEEFRAKFERDYADVEGTARLANLKLN